MSTERTGTVEGPHGRHEDVAPAPDDPEKPESPQHLEPRTWRYALGKAFREFTEDQCTDLAAALTYYAVLAIFPAAIALVSVLGLVGQSPQQTVDLVVDVLRPLVSEQTLGTVEPALTQLATAERAGLALVLGLAGALWTASGYVGAFSRAMNRIYEIDEGRPFWKLRPWMIVITLLSVLMIALVLLMLVVSGPLAESIGSVIGLGDEAVLAWSIAKWPVILLVVVLVVAILYYATPNVQQPRFRWLSVGAFVAIATWVVASVGFSVYVASFSSYNKTYGSLAGVIVTLVFLWITNLALLFGAEVDSELERGRQLQAGIRAEEELRLPARDTRQIEKAAEKEAKVLARGRRIRESADRDENEGRGARRRDENATTGEETR